MAGKSPGIRSDGPAAARSSAFRAILVTGAAVITLLGAVYFSSPFWAPEACRLTAARLWQVDLQLDEASFNPFTFSLKGRGGTFRLPPMRGYRAAGEIQSLEAEADLFFFLTRRKLNDVLLDAARLTVDFRQRDDGTPEPGKRSGRRPGRPEIRLAGAEERRGGGSVRLEIGRLQLKVREGIFRYDTSRRSGEASMELNYEATFQNIRDLEELTDMVLQDLAVKAAAVFLMDNFLR